jgi:Type IX secretion system protein PorV
MYYRVILLLISGVIVSQHSFSQNINTLGQESAITTAVPFLVISPDARHAALGDAGVATTPDANSTYWNPGKLAFIQSKYGASASYTPWLGKIVNDMSISYLTGFYKINRESAFNLALKYFDMGEITFTNNVAAVTGQFSPRDFSFDGSYSRMLSENLGIGLTAKYIYSNLTGTNSNVDGKPGTSVAVDIGLYYTKDLKWKNESTLSFGGSISNIGAKLSYTDNNNEDFLPMNLRLGSALTTALDPYNTITFVLDFNKLLVPSPPIRDETGAIVAGEDPNRSLLNAMFTSFSDAPNGAKEEFQEIMTSIGVEYWYNKSFAARVGYFNEASNKGNRKYLTLGLGFTKNRFGIDVAYLVPTAKREHPLAETLRFTLHFRINENSVVEESVTDDNP